MSCSIETFGRCEAARPDRIELEERIGCPTGGVNFETRPEAPLGSNRFNVV
jgi:hypothetical protein